MHYQANDHTSSQDQMWIVDCGCGLSIWRRSNDDPEVVPLPLKEMIKMCRTIEENSMVVCTEGALELVKALHQYRAHLQRMSREGERQTTPDDFFHL